ncbi:metallophosphoesterase [Methylobacterium sp. Leaf113]|uniref:metallophosphoesterase n=1 Tax=Methylobacterium sp. Leaf113 TaxID=1736259 RepID=UPI000701EF44|nr:metallophosphoesterase [Methylobacterium sp. Leaf113]KQP85449.1 metallophosphoesterase [Methylobacterium sp. Leaf113]
MPRTFFTADGHVGHKGILSPRFANRRPFSSIEEHDEAIVAAWNAVVRPDDIVWHLGDFAYKCSLDHAAGIFARLKGRKYLCRGNHDHGLGDRLEWAGPVVDVQRIFVQDPGMPKRVALWASHYAHVTWPHAWHGDLHVYGHSHGGIPATRTSLDVGVDCWDWRPVTLGRIMARMAASPAIAPPC